MDYRIIEAGRELDTLVARNVMGWTFFDGCGSAGPSYWQDDNLEPVYIDGGWAEWEPSTSIISAWQVLNAIIDNGIGLPEVMHDGQLWVVYIKNFGKVAVVASAEDAPLAICRAALLAVMEEETDGTIQDVLD